MTRKISTDPSKVSDTELIQWICKTLHQFIKSINPNMMCIYLDRIRVAFRDEYDNAKKESDMLITFTAPGDCDDNVDLKVDNHYIILWGENQDIFKNSKTIGVYDHRPHRADIIIGENYMLNYPKYIETFIKIAKTIVDKMKNDLPYKCTNIAMMYDSYYGQEFAWQPASTVPVLNGASEAQECEMIISDILYKYSARYPIHYIFRKSIIFNNNDKDYRAEYDFELYIQGVFDYKGDYSILTTYRNRDPKDAELGLDYALEYVDIQDLSRAISIYFSPLVAAKQMAYLPEVDKYNYSILTRVF